MTDLESCPLKTSKGGRGDARYTLILEEVLEGFQIHMSGSLGHSAILPLYYWTLDLVNTPLQLHIKALEST